MISTYNDWLRKQALSSVTQPLSVGVDSNDENYFRDQGYEKLGWRHFRRRVQFALSGQQKHLKNHIEPNWKRGLWIYKGVPQIGDALMDLAPRSLLRQQGICIDLYTDTHLAAMFNGDPWFERVYDDAQTIKSQNYDFVIVPSHKGRSLRHKSRLLPNLAWISMHGFYTGPEFHRGKFATQRIMDLLEHEATELEFAQHQQQKLRPLVSRPAERRDFTKIAFALGGVDASRTYNDWVPLTKALLRDSKKIEITLLGSTNAEETARVLMSACAATTRISNQVNHTDLPECRDLIQQQDVIIAADGGLMHLGATTKTRLVSLFHVGVDPLWRLSGAHLQSALQSATNKVSDIPVSTVVQGISKALNG